MLSNLTKEDIYKVIPKDVIFEIFDDYDLDIEESDHGMVHWGRVIENGILLSELNGADQKVIIGFGLFHDCQRENENYDPQHGYRGSQFMEEFKERINLTETQFKKVQIACTGHTDERLNADLDISTCWDSDRLDLMRVYIYPDRYYLNNNEYITTEMIEERSEIAKDNIMPDWVEEILEDYQSYQLSKDLNNIISEKSKKISSTKSSKKIKKSRVL